GDRRAAADEPVGPDAGTLERDLGAAAGPDRRVRLLDRPRADRYIFHLIKFSLERDVVLGPKPLHQLYLFDCAAAAMLEGNLDGFVVALAAAESKAEGHASIRNKVQGGDDFSEVAWMAQVGEQHGGAETNSPGGAGRRGE